MHSFRIGVVGASGYSGAVAARLIAGHPSFELAFCTSDKRAGASVASELAFGVRRDLTFEPNARAEELAVACDGVILATSAEVSARLAPALVDRNLSMVDLSGGFRLTNALDYPHWYGFEHPSPTLLGRAHYGLTELSGPIARGALVANPGCYPTAALLGLSPLMQSGLIEPKDIIIDAKSGVTGAGRQAKEEYSFAELDENIAGYKLLRHQHTPEITQFLGAMARGSDSAAAARSVQLTFTPHLIPIKRGLLATCYARPRPGITAAMVHECLSDKYSNRDFVHVVPPEQASVGRVVGTNYAHVTSTANTDRVIVISVIDNLLKGAAGQAIQNLNAMFGLPESTGLEHLHRSAP